MDLSRVKLQSLTGETQFELPEFDSPPADPIPLASTWISRAIETGVREPGSFVLATADGNGAPSTRFVLLKGFDERGVLFVSQITSRKGHDIAVNPQGSASFYWLELKQQLHLRGTIAAIPTAESDELFAARPVASQAGASISHQGEELADESEFVEQVEGLIEEGSALARPDRWTGFRLTPLEIEFWQGDTNRLHRRLAYEREGEGWIHHRLQP